MKPPNKICLQLDGDGGDEYIEDSATWSPDRIYDSDVEYVRVDEREAKNEKAE